MTRGATSFSRIEGLDTFAQTVGRLGERLGPVRIKVGQKRDDGFLRLLLDSLDPALRWALDFRHESWKASEIADRLDERGIVTVGALEGEASFRYLRFRDPPYPEEALEEIAATLHPLLADGIELYCYFRHEDEPTAPRYAEQLLELVRGPQVRSASR
jgi:uncharacterized protein YecE (DUF72 family)